MLARRLPAILPAMSFDEAIETTKIHSVAGLLSEKDGLIGTRPFSAPSAYVEERRAWILQQMGQLGGIAFIRRF